MGGSITEPLIGVAVGHLYYFVIEVLPFMDGYHMGELIITPKFCVSLMTWYTGMTAPQPAPRPAPVRNAVPATGAGGYNWGRGNRLGGS